MIRFSTVVGADAVDAAMDRLLPALPQGVHERPAGPGRVELYWFGDGAPPDGFEIVQAPAPDDPQARRHASEPVWHVGPFAIRSPDAPPAPLSLREIVITGGAGSFGTGAHPTTTDSLTLLLEVEPQGALADLGCGAGVLSVAAAMLGFDPVLAVDVEPAAVAAARANAARNEVAVSVEAADLLAVPPPAAETLVANLPEHVHLAVAPNLPARARTVVVSGIAPDAADAVTAAYGLGVRRRIDTAGWATLRLERA